MLICERRLPGQPPEKICEAGAPIQLIKRLQELNIPLPILSKLIIYLSAGDIYVYLNETIWIYKKSNVINHGLLQSEKIKK